MARRRKAEQETGRKERRRGGRGRGFLGALLVLALLFALAFAALALVRLDRSLRTAFESHRWTLPAKVYARPLDLYAGAPWQESDVVAELQRLHYRIGDLRQPGSYQIAASDLLVHTRGFHFADAVTPEQVLRLHFTAAGLNRLSASQGDATLVRLDPMIIGSIYPGSQEDRVLMRLQDAPPSLIAALLATEDRSFYHHHGISLRGSLRALWTDARHGNWHQGGSTLTQQLVKNLFLSDERTWHRKLREVVMALLLELHYSKNEILEAYLNEVYLGQVGQHAVHGFALAAQDDFGQPVRDLDVAEVATLVGMVRGPSLYDPHQHPRLALRRRNVVLANMLATHAISRQDYQRYVATPLRLIRHPNASGTIYPAYMEVVRAQLHSDYRDADLGSQGLRIFTNLDPRVEEVAQRSLQSERDRLRRQAPRQRRHLQGAVLVCDPQNGDLLAVVGSADGAAFTGYNRALDIRRPVGSLLKPALYLSALSTRRVTLATPLDNGPLQLDLGNGQTWAPHNDEAGAPASVPLYAALAHSYNLASIRLGLQVGLPTFIQTLQSLGLPGQLPALPSLFLGAIAASPMDVLHLYQSIAASGFSSPIHAIRVVVDAHGQAMQRYELEMRQVADASDVYLLRYALHQVMLQGTAAQAGRVLPGQVDMAGKTGTSNDLRDSWFAGFTGDLLSVVWLGNDDDSSTGLSGAQAALPVWIAMMRTLHPTPLDLPQPDDIVWQWMDPASGLLTDAGCPDAVNLPLRRSTVPTQHAACAAPALPVVDQFVKGVRSWFGHGP